MPYLIESNEWRLLQELGRLLDQKKARYYVQARLLNGHERVQTNSELIEVELRRVFMVKEIHQNLDPVEFERCQAKLNSLCSLLDGLARSTNADSGTEGLAYPRLQALTSFIKSTPGNVDLASGSNETLFRLPHDAGKLCDCLRIVTECNDVLSPLLAPPSQAPVIQPLQKQQKRRAWKKAVIRNRAMFVLETLFKHFRCGTPHEVLLELNEDPDEDSVLPSLQLMLSPCFELESWQEARCDSVNIGETSILSIPDICTDLQQYINQGKALVFLVEKHGLFGAWSDPTSSVAGLSSKESLDQLILKGVFKPLNLSIFYGESPARINTKDKRALAVKLGFCLMDFFDVNLTSKRIYFLDFSKQDSKKELPYLAFSSKLPVAADLYNFQMGHPTLLSFAKLLLEMEFGENINLDISPNNSENKTVWTKLMIFVERLEEERSDSYLQAIRGCLVVHSEIAKALRSRNPDRRDADLIIRKKLHKKVVHKLELGLAESIPSSAQKRRRSPSPPSDRLDGAQAASSAKRAMHSVQSEGTVPRYKKRSEYESRMWAPPAVSKSTHGETGELCDDNTLARYTADLCQLTLISNQDIEKYEPCTIITSSSRPILPSRGSKTMPSLRPSRRDDFEIAIICALPLEYDAVSYILDEFWDEAGDEYGRAAGDLNSYSTGRIGKYNVVLALLPHMGKVNAASAVASMRSSYSGLRLVLIVGVCGGMPRSKHSEILLGDVIISKTVIQYDFGRQYSDRFTRKNTVEDSLSRPNKDVRNLLATFETDRGLDRLETRTASVLQQLQAKVALTKRHGKYDYPGIAEDKLFESNYRHKHRLSPSCICLCCSGDLDPVCEKALHSSCADVGCDDGYLITRTRLQAKGQPEQSGNTVQQPVIHVGAIASGDAVLKSAVDRDRLSQETGVIGFEMEGAGVWDEVPCIVVKGVCDYADSHKHNGWQNFAAATAASAAKAILERYIRTDKF